MITKTIEITLLEDDWEILIKYDYNFIKNMQQEAKIVAALLREEEKTKSEEADN